MRDPYDVLGLPPGAERDEVRSAYRRLARECHPDRFAGQSAEIQEAAQQRMQEINHAFDVLTNPVEWARFQRRRRLEERRAAAASSRVDGAAAPASPDGTSRREGPVRFSTGQASATSSAADSQAPRRERDWRTAPPPARLHIREFKGWGDAHWVYVHAPGGRAGMMNVTTGEVTIEREELREDVLRILQHYAIDSWA